MNDLAGHDHIVGSETGGGQFWHSAKFVWIQMGGGKERSSVYAWCEGENPKLCPLYLMEANLIQTNFPFSILD